MAGAGTAHGEPPEQLWADLGPLGKTTQYMSRSKREALLEGKLAHRELKRDHNLAHMLVRMQRQAEARQAEARRSVQQLLQQMQELGLSREEVRGTSWGMGFSSLF